MDPTLLGRAALPVLLAAFVVLLLVWPVVRLRREAGVQAVTLHREGAPGRRFGAAALLAVGLAIGALTLLYAIGGSAAVGAWRAPVAVVGLGIALAVCGLAIVSLAQRQMGASFRIGIDDARTPLVASGLFRWIRNPIFSGILLMLLGVVLIVPGPWSAALWLAAFGAIAWQVRLEERHLLAMHGDAYRRYAARTGRFVPGIGRRVDGGAS